MDSLKFFDFLKKENGRQKRKWSPNKQNGRQIAKLSITRSCLELQSPDFACKLVWTVQTNFEIFLKNKMATKKQNGRQTAKLSITHSFLELQSTDFT